MPADSKFAIYTSLAANVAIAVTKFTAAALTGSSAMIAEGIHSLVDTADGSLLLLGQYRSQRRPDTQHPFGYGQELYFWTLIVAILFFALGGGVSVYEGILHMIRPAPLTKPGWSYGALAFSALFDGASFVVAFRTLRRDQPHLSILQAVRRGKDPSIFTVAFEDVADLTGVAIAFLGVFLSHLYKAPWIDGAASIGVGLVLAGVAMVLISESHELLIGERASHEVLDAVHAEAAREGGILTIQRVLTMHLGPGEILLVLDLNFAHDISLADASHAIARIEEAVRKRTQLDVHIYVESRALRAKQET